MKQYQCSCRHGHFFMFFILSAATVELSHSLRLCFAKRWRTSTHLSSSFFFLPPCSRFSPCLPVCIIIKDFCRGVTLRSGAGGCEKNLQAGLLLHQCLCLHTPTHPRSPFPSSPLPHFRCPCHLLVKLNMTISWVLSHIPSEIHPFIWEEIPAGPT